MAIIPSFLAYNAFIIFLIIKIVSAHHKTGFPGGSVVKNLPANEGDLGLIPGSGRFPGKGNGNLLAWEIPWTEEPGGLQSMGLQKSWTRLSD